MSWLLHFMRIIFTRRPCPPEGIKWRNVGMPPGDYIHDVYMGECKVCGMMHQAEQGEYWRMT